MKYKREVLIRFKQQINNQQERNDGEVLNHLTDAEVNFSNCIPRTPADNQEKKDVDEAQTRQHLEPQQTMGEDIKSEHMPKCPDNHPGFMLIKSNNKNGMLK